MVAQKIHDVMLPDEWYTHNHQLQMFRANIKYPIFTDAFPDMTEGYRARHPKCFVPNFGDDSIKLMFERSEKGDPLFYEKREELCLLFTPIINGFNYELCMYGRVRGNEVVPGYIPDYFVSNATEAQCMAQLVLRDNATDSNYEILGTKLNQLSNGRCNIVMYLKFPNGCPFTQQTYLRSTSLPDAIARVMPHPIVTKFKEDSRGVKLIFKFLDVDKELFHKAYALVRSLVTTIPGLFMRFVKQRREEKCLDVVCQLEDDADMGAIESALQNLRGKKNMKSIFSPYVLVEFEWESVVI